MLTCTESGDKRSSSDEPLGETGAASEDALEPRRPPPPPPLLPVVAVDADDGVVEMLLIGIL